MSVIITRAIIVPSGLLKSYYDVQVLVLSTRFAYTLDLLDLESNYNKIGHREIVVKRSPMRVLTHMDASSSVMYTHARDANDDPDQLGLLILDTDGIKSLYIAE